MIDSVLEDLLPEKYLPPKLIHQVLGKNTAQELLSEQFQFYYLIAIHSRKPLPAWWENNRKKMKKTTNLLFDVLIHQSCHNCL